MTQLGFDLDNNCIGAGSCMPHQLEEAPFLYGINQAGSTTMLGRAPSSLLSLFIDSSVLGLDTETDQLPWFNKKNKKALTYIDHPRLATVRLIGISDGNVSVVLTQSWFHLLHELTDAGKFTFVFHNLFFDLPLLQRLGFFK